MKIGVDGTALSKKHTGIARYIVELCKQLDKELPNAVFYVYSNRQINMPVCSERWILRQDTAWWAKYLKSIIWLKIRAVNLCKKDEIDFFWGACTFLPHFSRDVTTISTVYDLNLYVAPETMARGTYWTHKLFFKKDVMKADYVTAISYGTAKRLIDNLGRNVDSVMHPSISKNFNRPSHELINKTMEKLNIKNPYLLAVGTLEPRKNLENLIKAFVNLKIGGLIPTYSLVLVGRSGWKNNTLKKLIIKYRSIGLISVGYVPDEDLPSLYSGAEVFIFPSIYEGFGIPVLEARMCKTRILASDIDEIQEAGGIGPLYIKPTVDNLTNGILELLSDTKIGVGSQEALEIEQKGLKLFTEIFKSKCLI